MARKDFYVAKDTQHPLYKTRMLQAGVPIPLDASAARLFGKLGVELSDQAPRRAAPKAEAEIKAAMTEVQTSEASAKALDRALSKAAPAKKAARRKKS